MKVTVKISNPLEKNSPVFKRIRRVLEKENLFVKNPIVLEELRVNDPFDFGKGYGKNAFLSVLNQYDVPIVIYPFAVFYDSKNAAYSGRRKMDSYESLEKGVEELIELFYKPLILKSGRKFIEEKSDYGGGTILIVL